MSTENEEWCENSFDKKNTGAGRNDNRSYNREGGERPYHPSHNCEDGDHPYRPRFNANNEGGERPQRPYGGHSYSDRPQCPSYNREGGDRPYRSRFSNNNEGGERPQRLYNRGDNSHGRPQRSPYNREGSSYGHSRRPCFNSGEGGGRPQRPSYNRKDGDRPHCPCLNDGEDGDRPQCPSYNRGGGDRPHRSRFDNGGDGGYRSSNDSGGGHCPRYNNDRSRGDCRSRPRTGDYDPNVRYNVEKQIEYKGQSVDPNEPIYLNKFLVNIGACSRREVDESITADVVFVSGEVVTELGTEIKRSDVIKFHDKPISIERRVYVLLNRPEDTVTTSDNPRERRTVMDSVKGAYSKRIYPVGRSDRNTIGVLLLTNDGDLASKLTHPKFLKRKIYHVHLDKNLTRMDMDQIAAGIQLEDGKIHADVISYTNDFKKDQIGIEIHSDKNRIVRRISESLGYRIVKLDRVFFTGLTKKGLYRGDWRYLSEAEVNYFRIGSSE